ncbi:LuxR C-terminal-related transcriptional regulator [Streptomyces sp. NPDC001941]|uniref:helix-turn-helix transcriptional regulator n=1 Tax=Streptomyces sp. NPDC001941 TaxID=3154659 RepID=UPI00332EF12A
MAVHASDVTVRTGVVQQLAGQRDLTLLPEDDTAADRADVVLVLVDRVDDDALLTLNRLRHRSAAVALVVSTVEPRTLHQIIEHGVHALLRRTEAHPRNLAALVRAVAAGEGVLPGDLIGELITYTAQLQHAVPEERGGSLTTLTRREAEMLRLVAEGLDTAEIAAKTSYSERTVKNVLHEVTTRLNLRNRTHAVGHALRHQLI